MKKVIQESKIIFRKEFFRFGDFTANLSAGKQGREDAKKKTLNVFAPKQKKLVI
jgi:hypothetical protein